MTDLSGKTAIITGASRGIGEAAARAFSAAGANVVLTARSAGDIGQIAEEITAAGGKALAVAGDVSRYDDINAVVTKALGSFGSLDILINNAGMIDPISHLIDADPQDWGRIIDINVKGVFHGMRAALPHMKPGGTVITISSGAAHNALEGWSAYCTSKAGAAMLTMAAHKENGANGIRIMGLSPGLVATDMQVKIRQSGLNPVSQIDPNSHRPPLAIAKVLLWMCTPEADEFLGQEISIQSAAVRKKIGIR